MENTPIKGTRDIYPPEYFRRQDESDDGLFYTEPRLVVHIDDNAIAAIGDYFRKSLPQNGTILDLMSSWRSHLPDDFPKGKLVGLGMNDVEMKENPQLDEFVVRNLNTEPSLPFDDNEFDAVMVTVSIQYLTKPIEVFREVNRVLKPAASLHVIYSNRMFPTKAVYIWQMLDDNRKAELLFSYFQQSGSWNEPIVFNITPESTGYTDPVYVVAAQKGSDGHPRFAV